MKNHNGCLVSFSNSGSYYFKGRSIIVKLIFMRESFSPMPEMTEKKSIWQRLRDYKKTVAFVALMTMASPTFAGAAEKIVPSSEGKKIEDQEKKRENDKKNILKIVENIKTKGQEGRMGQTPVRKWIAKSGDMVVVGFSDKDSSKAMWVINESKDGGTRYFDKNADGQIDRFILNNEDGASKGKKSAENGLNTFIPMDKIAETAGVEADLMPTKIKVYEFNSEDSGPTIKSVNFETGEANELEGEQAKTLTERVQNLFGGNIAERSAEISQ